MSPNFGPRARRFPPRHDHPALHRHEDWRGRRKLGFARRNRRSRSHYLVHEDGRIVQMVRESDRAWHAGKSFWRGVTDVNSHSVGIEIANPGHEFGYRSFRASRSPRSSISAGASSPAIPIRAAARARAIPTWRPAAKSTPARSFRGGSLPRRASAILSRRPRAGGKPLLGHGDRGAAVEELQSMLSLYGYGIDITGVYDPPTSVVVSAFRLHFRPRRVDGLADRSTVDTLRRLLEALPTGAG